MKFILEIELGNDAMMTPRHLARAIANLHTVIAYETVLEHITGRIKDVNGNTVGRYHVEE